MTIALLCPTRGRPEQCRRMIESAAATTLHANVSVYLGIQGEDYPKIKFPRHDFGIARFNVPDWPTSMTWNWLADHIMNDKIMADQRLFMLAADDMVFSTPCWDTALLDHYNALENKIHVYALRDSRDANGTPHPIVTREYIEAMGYFLPPLFLHWFVDSWTVEIARASNCFTHLKDYMLIHDKPSDRGQADETHNRIRSMGWHERDRWVADKMKPWLENEKKELAALINAQKDGPTGKYL